MAQAPLETQGVDLNRNFDVSFASSAGHPVFTEDQWIAKADKKKAGNDEESLMQTEEEDEQTDEQKDSA